MLTPTLAAFGIFPLNVKFPFQNIWPNRGHYKVNIIGISLKYSMTIYGVGLDLKKIENAAKVGVDKGKFEPLSTTILTKCTPVSSRALNFRSKMSWPNRGQCKVNIIRIIDGQVNAKR